MTPKEKAEELYNKFWDHADEGGDIRNTAYYGQTLAKRRLVRKEQSKQCALIAVNEIIDVLNPENWGLEMNIAIDELIYWRTVKQEIESL